MVEKTPENANNLRLIAIFVTSLLVNIKSADARISARHYIEGGVKLLFTSKKNYTLKKYTTLISFFSENIQFFK